MRCCVILKGGAGENRAARAPRYTEDLSADDAVYFTFITMTTVGDRDLIVFFSPWLRSRG